jgi:hypothetical protein
LDDKGGHQYNIMTYWEHIVSEYTGLNMLDIENLDYMDYLIYRRDAFIWKMSQTEKGEKYLDNAWRLEQTQPDRQALRKKFREEG